MINEVGSNITVSVVVTVKNEERHIENLLGSLINQEPPVEIIIVDAKSTDKTEEIIKGYAEKYDNIHLYSIASNRAEGRNYGCKMAKGKTIAFIDGDCVADSRWVAEIRRHVKNSTVVAGKTVLTGRLFYNQLDRVELYIKNFDVTYPSTNLAYPADLFKRIGGFDSFFVTAEDIDLNIRAAQAGGTIKYVDTVVVTHYTRENIFQFIKQAFWNGYGRKQLTYRYGNLWKSYKPANMFKGIHSFLGMVRIVFALAGYTICIFTIKKKNKSVGGEI